MSYLTESEVTALPLGARVVFPEGAQAYPDFFLTERLTGTVAEKAIDSTWIRIDQPCEELAEWDNQIQVWVWDDENGQAAYPMERLFSCDRPDELSELVNAYCSEHGITVDGDAFGLAFSAVSEEWTTHEAVQIIETFADLYSLRVPA